MDGRRIFNFVKNTVFDELNDFISEVGKDIDLIIPHQASINMLKLIASKVGLPENKLKTIMHKYGNVAGASIPIALSEALENNEIKKGDKILLTAIGSGWSWGSIVLNYE